MLNKKHTIRNLASPEAAQDIDDNFDSIAKAIRDLNEQVTDLTDTVDDLLAPAPPKKPLPILNIEVEADERSIWPQGANTQRSNLKLIGRLPTLRLDVSASNTLGLIQFYRNNVHKGFLGLGGQAQDLLVSSAADDIALANISGNKILFGANASFNTDMAITSAGVGIGTVDVNTAGGATKLHLKAGTGTLPSLNFAATLLIQSNSQTTSAANIGIVAGNAALSAIYFSDVDAPTRGAVQYDHSDDSLALWSANTKAIHIDSSQRVGVGTAIPEVLLHVSGSGAGALVSATSGNASIAVRPASNASGRLDFQDDLGVVKAVIYSTDNSSNLVFTTDGLSTRMLIDSTGRVGIGTASPLSKLNLQGGHLQIGGSNIGDNSSPLVITQTSTATGLIHLRPNSGNSQYITFTENGISDNGAIGFDAGSSTMNFWTGGNLTSGSERLVITSDGKVGIGTSTPETRLHITGGQTTAPTSLDSATQLLVTGADGGNSQSAIAVLSKGTFSSTIYLGILSDPDAAEISYNNSLGRLSFRVNATTEAPYFEQSKIVVPHSSGGGNGTTLSLNSSGAGTWTHSIVTSNTSVADGASASGITTFKQAVGGVDDQTIMTMRANRLGIGITVPDAILHVDQSSTTGAIPVLTLDQADDSEEMIEFIGTIGTGNAIEAVGAKTLTTTHFIKVTLPGGLTRYFPVGTIA